MQPTKKYCYFEFPWVLPLMVQKNKNYFMLLNLSKCFSSITFIALKIQLNVYIMNVDSNNKFSKLKGIGKLIKKIVDTKIDKLYSLIFSCLNLALLD